jgi:TP901 family phage tail tape measure protein
MASFIIPTIYTATDKYSSVVDIMSSKTRDFGEKAQAFIGKGEKAFGKLGHVLDHAQEHVLELYSTVVLASKLVQGVEFSFESVVTYGEKIADLKATTGLTGKAFDAFNDKIIEVAKSSEKSAIDVADVFKIVAKANPDLLNNAEALGKISDASILMAKATGMELGPAAESLTVLMSKMQIGANDAGQTVDVLSAASQAGKYKVNELADGLTQFSATAKAMKMSLAESAGLLQLSSSFAVAGEGANESGAHIRKFLMVLEQAKIISPGISAALKHAGISTKMLADPTVSLTEKVEALQKIQGKGALLDKLFGPRNAEFVKGLLSHAGALDEIIKKTGEQGKAEEMAAIREGTLDESLKRLKAAWLNVLIGSGKAGEGLTIFQKAIDFLSHHMKIIVEIGGAILGLFIAWKALMIASRIVMVGYNIVLGITSALQGQSALALVGNTIAYGAYRMVVVAATAAQWLLNAAMLANPIGLIIIGIVALIALVYEVIKHWNEWGAVVSLFLGPLGTVISLIQSFRRNWEMIKKSFAEGGIVEGLKAIGVTILDCLLQPIEALLKLIGKLPTWLGGGLAVDAASSIEGLRKAMGVNVDTDESGNPLKPKIAAVNPKVEQEMSFQKMFALNEARATLTINDPNNRTNVESSGKGLQINTVSTHPAK